MKIQWNWELHEGTKLKIIEFVKEKIENTKLWETKLKIFTSMKNKIVNKNYKRLKHLNNKESN